MKRLALGLVLTLAALDLMVSPAMADSGSPHAAPALSAEDQEFIASLILPDPTPAAKRPIVGKATCSASCWDGSVVTCTGTTCSGTNSNCAAGERGRVICDGNPTKCPKCIVDCTALENQCADTCGFCPILSFTCDPYSCRCDFNPNCV
jgi:hypothetical protein